MTDQSLEPIDALKFTADAKARVVQHVRECGRNINLMARVGCVGRDTIYEHLKRDPEFAEAVDQAQAEFVRSMENEAYRRAVKGNIRRKYTKDGDLIEEELVYSDTLLMFLLKANDPKYKEHIQVDQHVQGGVMVVQQQIGPKEATSALEQLSAMQDRLKAIAESGEKK